MPQSYAISALWDQDFDENKLESWAEELRKQLIDETVSLGFIFLTPPFFEHANKVMEIIRVHAHVPLLMGCSSHGIIINGEEIEQRGGMALSLFNLPGADLRAFALNANQVNNLEEDDSLLKLTRSNENENNGWLLFADPFHLRSDKWLDAWNSAFAPKPIVGGLASGNPDEHRTFLYLDGTVFDEGVVALSVGGDVALKSIISQGCTPIGETWTITQAEDNIIHKIGNRPAFDLLVDTLNDLPEEIKARANRNLFTGLVIDEYREDFGRGDFLIRNLIGGDPKLGSIAIGAYPRVGQTIQFQLRDAQAASEDMDEMLLSAKNKLADTMIYGACLCSCSGRGEGLFGQPNHDAGLVQKHLGPLALSGFFCNGEIGPVGDNSYLHAYTASLALFVKNDFGTA
jgi:small ligand-binding sensory domain FIST